MKKEDVKRFGIVIFESLSDNEIKTGYELYSETLNYKKYEADFLTVEYYDCNDKKDFLDKLLKIVNEAIDNNYFYILHFEIHGFNGGLILKNNEEVNWSEILPIFQLLNIHYRNTLTIHLAVCEGGSLIKDINPLGRSPFGYLVCSPEKIYEKDLIEGFKLFYDKFFFDFDFEDSLNAYNNIVKNPSSLLSLIDSKYCIDTLCDIDRDTADRQRLLEILKTSFNNNHPNFKDLPESIAFDFLEKRLNEIFDDCKLNKDYYLMTDLKI